jgi:hypothetical protein
MTWRRDSRRRQWCSTCRGSRCARGLSTSGGVDVAVMVGADVGGCGHDEVVGVVGGDVAGVGHGGVNELALAWPKRGR